MKRPGVASLNSFEAPQADSLEASTPERQLGSSSAASSVHNETTEPNDSDNNHSQLLDHTPIVLKHQGDKNTHANSQRTRQSAVGHGQIAPVDNFDNDYLRTCEDYRKDKSDEHWNRFKEDLSECKLESDMYPIIVKFLTELCIAVCKPRTLLFICYRHCLFH